MNTKTEIKPQEFFVCKRERELVLLAAKCLSNREIADTLCLSECTVKAVMHRLYVKLEARNRYQAMKQAINRRLLSIEEMCTEDELVDLLATAKPEVIDRIAHKALSKTLYFNYRSNSTSYRRNEGARYLTATII
jgi:DNA-binding CsgD family transcriptional regulator